jgi:hypothetical protein
MMDEQLAQNQTIEALRRQVETSNNSARDAQALLRSSQDQQVVDNSIRKVRIQSDNMEQVRRDTIS